MDTDGSKILDDDTAYEVMQEYKRARKKGVSGPEIAEFVLKSMQEELSDSDEGPVIYLVLAYLLCRDRLSAPNIYKRAIEIIKNEEGLDRWRESGASCLSERQKILDSLLKTIKSHYETC